MQAHLYEFRIAASYDKWIFHGEEDDFVDTGGFNVGGLHMNHEDETNIEDEGADEMYDLMHDMLGSTSKDRGVVGYIQEKDVLEVQDEHVFYQRNESCNTVLRVQHDDLESELFHRDDINADVIEDPSLHEERMVTTQNMDDFICNEDEENETIDDYCSDEINELQSKDDSNLDHNIT
ncbi:hypothetical protein ACOSQ2_004645 [Xanthoceras sorbifolium]